MYIRVNSSQETPLYQQIFEKIKALIEQNALEVDQALPSSRSLAKKLGVNRSTVIRAYEELQALGYLYSRPGSYNRVRERYKEIEYDPERRSHIDWEEISHAPARKGYKIYQEYFPEGFNRNENFSDVINISQLDLDPRIYPLNEFKKCVNQVLWNFGSEALSYGNHKGFPPLRREIARRLRLHGISVSEEEILITNGAQQAIDLITRTLGRPDRCVVSEEPTYSAAIPLFRLNGIELVGIPMTDAGMDLDGLEEVLEKRDVSFVYTIPNFQNPTGITSSQEHRERLLNMCYKHGVPIVEDGFEEDMKYFGKVPLPIKSVDDKNIVVYIGTFSKALFPGLRIGWITADSELIDRLTAIKRFSDLSSSNLAQNILYEFLKRGYYDLQLRRLHRIFRRRMSTALRTIESKFPPSVKWTRPSGGYTIWVEISKKLDEKQLGYIMKEYGVIVSPGVYYFLHKRASKYFRICIAKTDEKEIIKGLSRLGKALHLLERGH